jgi:hypothetical protein
MKIMDMIQTITVKQILHWCSFAAFAYFFGYAGLFKIFKVKGMMDGMAAIGFGERATVLIGIVETIGVAVLFISLAMPALKSPAVLLLLPFGIGAFTVHLSYHHTIGDYFASLLVCITGVVILLTDSRFKIIMGG